MVNERDSEDIDDVEEVEETLKASGLVVSFGAAVRDNFVKPFCWGVAGSLLISWCEFDLVFIAALGMGVGKYRY